MFSLYVFYLGFQDHGSFRSKGAMVSRSAGVSDGKVASQIGSKAKVQSTASLKTNSKTKEKATSTASSQVIKSYAKTTATTTSKVARAAMKSIQKNKSTTCGRRERPRKRQPGTSLRMAGSPRAGPHAGPKAKSHTAPRPSVLHPTTLEVTPPVSVVAADRQLTNLSAIAELHSKIMYVILCLLRDLHTVPFAIIDHCQESVRDVFDDFRNTVITGVEGQYFEETVRSSCNQPSS